MTLHQRYIVHLQRLGSFFRAQFSQMIDSMITKLLEEANEESDKKGWSACIISSREGRIQHRFTLPPERGSSRELERRTDFRCERNAFLQRTFRKGARQVRQGDGRERPDPRGQDRGGAELLIQQRRGVAAPQNFAVRQTRPVLQLPSK